MADNPILTDNIVVLRRFNAFDREALASIAGDKKVSRYLADRFPYPYGLAEADAWIALVSCEVRTCNFAIEWQGNLVGGAGLQPMDDIHSGTAEFGYWLGVDYWGKGLASRAARLLADYAFNELLFVRLQAEVFNVNPASMRVLEKTGFTKEGTLRRHIRKDGVIYDSALYARLRSEG